MFFCTNQESFYAYFKENMNALGLPAPEGLFNSVGTAVGTASTILGTIDTLGKGATMLEIAGATVALEKLAVLGAMSASIYAGAVIGSIAVATGRTLSCGSRIADFFAFTQQHNLYRPWLLEHMNKYPYILEEKPGFIRKGYGVLARQNVA